MKIHRAFQIISTPLGEMFIQSINDQLTHCDFIEGKNTLALQTIMQHESFHLDTPILSETQRQLQNYFKGKLTQFDLPLAVHGTKFQQKVWQALQTIAYGKTASYADIARQIQSPKAVRAVGAANGKNSLAIIVPCHRVIGSNGSLTGYAGGLDRKKALLHLEQTTVSLVSRMSENG